MKGSNSHVSRVKVVVEYEGEYVEVFREDDGTILGCFATFQMLIELLKTGAVTWIVTRVRKKGEK